MSDYEYRGCLTCKFAKFSKATYGYYDVDCAKHPPHPLPICVDSAKPHLRFKEDGTPYVEYCLAEYYNEGVIVDCPTYEKGRKLRLPKDARKNYV